MAELRQDTSNITNTSELFPDNYSFFTSNDEMDMEDDNADFTARPYQLEMFEKAKEQNSILLLPSSSGKTFISVLMIQEYAAQIRGPLSGGTGNKRTVYIVPNKPLAHQQADAIKRHTALNVGIYEAVRGADKWTHDEWKFELDKNEVLVFVAQIFLDLLLSARLPLSLVNLIIIDECHHATGKHPMRQIMREYKTFKQSHPHLCPRVLGLTACVVNGRGKNLMEKIKDLEYTMHSTLVLPSDYGEISNSIIPEEIIVCYESIKPAKPTRFQKLLIDKIRGIRQNLAHLLNGCDSKQTSYWRSYVNNMLDNINYVKKELGEWCVFDVIRKELIELQDEMPEGNNAVETNFIITFLYSKLKEMYCCLKSRRKTHKQVKYLSDKVFKLLDIIKSCGPDIQAIIFVKSKYIAKLMYKILLIVSQKHNKFTFMKPGNIFESAGNKDELNQDVVQQNEALRNFAMSECNILISTSVLEEGSDLGNCNTVIRFEKPYNYQSYIQSRSRARVFPSKYFLMVEEIHEKVFKNTLNKYKELEVCLAKLCKDREVPNDSDSSIHFTDCSYIRPYEPYGVEGPKVTMNSAIPLINKYCSRLPKDEFTVLTPQIEYETRVERVRKCAKNYMEFIAESPENKTGEYITEGEQIPRGMEVIRAGIRLPINACLKETIYGDWMYTRDHAKKSAALAMCQKLHEMEELDYHINPYENMEESFLQGLVEVPREANVEPGQPQPGTKKRKQIYEKETCEAFVVQRSGYDLYSITLIQAESSDSIDEEELIYKRKPVAYIPNETTIGFLCQRTSNLINCPFPLYSPMLGEVEVNVKLIKSIERIDYILRNQIEHFHKLVFENLLPLNSSVFQFNPKEAGVFIVPLTNTGAFNKKMLQDIHQLTTLRPAVQRNYFEYIRSNYEDAIIYPIYAPSEPFFYVTKILDHINPTSKFPDSSKGYENYEQYFCLKYNMQIKNKMQPLIEAKHMIKDLNYLKKPYITPKKAVKSLDSNPPKFIPELCGIMPLRASFWWKVMCFPSILHRLNSIYLAQQLGKTVNPRYCPSNHGVTKVDWAEAITKNPKTSYLKGGRRKKKFNDNDTSDEPCKKAARFESPSPQKQDKDDDIDQETSLQNISENLKDNVANISQNLKDNVASLIENLKDNVAGLSENLKNNVADISENLKDNVADISENLKDSVADISENLKDNIANLSENLKESIASLSENLKDNVADLRECLKDNVAVCVMKNSNKFINPVTLLQAMTLHEAYDDFDLERMEILGDSFLKFITAEYLSLKFPKDPEGRLSLRRVKLVCNLTLYGLAKLRGIHKKIQGTKFRPYNNGIMPGFIVKSSVQKQLKRLQVPHVIWHKLSDFGHITNLQSAVDEALRSEKDNAKYHPCLNPWKEHELTDKCIADVVEALIGAYLINCGSDAAIDFLHNLGVGVYNGKSLLKTDVKVQSALLSEEPDAVNEVMNIYQRKCLDRLEEKIQYTFKDKSYIVAAITHNSYCKNQVTDCYQRVEFLGDALLDYLITGMVYSRHTQYTPGQMSDLRAHFVSNKTLGSVCESHKIYQYLLHMSPKLQASIDKYITIRSDPKDDNEGVEVPKVLGDLVESLLGAVYLDSGRSLQEAWNVVQILMGSRILKSLDEISLNPIARLAKEAPGVKYNRILRDDRNEDAKCEIMIPGLPTLMGKGKNRCAAKMAAATMGLDALYKAQEGQPIEQMEYS